MTMIYKKIYTSRFWARCLSFIKLYKHSLLVLLIIVFYCEFLVYRLQTSLWKDMDQYCGNDCTKVLFVADPQIEGYHSEMFPFNYVFIWDADGYLHNTFTVVMKYFNPNLIVYLGDITDRGSESNAEEFKGYRDRILKIFQVPSDVQEIFLPGDNDIGGEGEPIYQNIVHVFNTLFFTRDVFRYKNITFYCVNQQMNVIPEPSKADTGLRVVLSHYPIAMFSKINSKIEPKLYFVGHDHDSSYYKSAKPLTLRKRHKFEEYGILEVDLDSEISVIGVPTCSYRMGTPKIGYGAAVFSKNNTKLHYTVYWTPERFPLLCYYLAFLIFLVLRLIFKKVVLDNYSHASRYI